jgi:hypothetical protein
MRLFLNVCLQLHRLKFLRDCSLASADVHGKEPLYF